MNYPPPLGHFTHTVPKALQQFPATYVVIDQKVDPGKAKIHFSNLILRLTAYVYVLITTTLDRCRPAVQAIGSRTNQIEPR
jgi:hypothetical protein